ncbi:hypothetical protein L7F22_055629 [Adiantum nelumboides]|nr:hypothetical protein [Adiantum nelumboides]
MESCPETEQCSTSHSDKGKQAVRAVRVSKVISALMLNANTSVSVPINLSNQVLSLLGFVGKHPLNVLMDSGCSTNFVSITLNAVADALSQMPKATNFAISGVQMEIPACFKNEYQMDKDFGDAFRALKSLNPTPAEMNMFASYIVMDELLYYLDRICVPHTGALRKILIQDNHEIRLASWEEYLPLVEFAYNNAPHSVNGMTPFQAAYGHTPLVPTNFVLQHKVALADQLVQEMQDILVQVRDKLVHVQQKYQKQANKHRRHAEFNEGIKAFDTQESEMIIEPALKWAGNPNILVAVKAFGLKATIQLVDLQVFAIARLTFKPLVPSFPCFSKIVVTLMEKPHIDFGLKLLGGDLMAIPGLYGLVQDLIKEEIAKLYLWPRSLEIAILDEAKGVLQKPVGILRVKILNARNLKKADVMGKSDPYVKISLGDKTLSKKSQVRKNTTNPDWNETHTLVVQDPSSQVLELHVYDWEKVSSHDKLGMQVIPLASLAPEESKLFTLNLRKNMDDNDPSNQKSRGQLTVEVTYKAFKEDEPVPDETEEVKAPEGTPQGGGLLVVVVHKAYDLEGKHHTNPFAKVIFKGQEFKTKPQKKARDPKWPDGKFEIVCDEPPLNDRVRIEVMSKGSGLGLHLKESLGYVETNLADVVRNKRINDEYVLVDSRNGKVHVELMWLPS